MQVGSSRNPSFSQALVQARRFFFRRLLCQANRRRRQLVRIVDRIHVSPLLQDSCDDARALLIGLASRLSGLDMPQGPAIVRTRLRSVVLPPLPVGIRTTCRPNVRADPKIAREDISLGPLREIRIACSAGMDWQGAVDSPPLARNMTNHAQPENSIGGEGKPEHGSWTSSTLRPRLTITCGATLPSHGVAEQEDC